jgi:preprotein translocase subunit YajC
VCSSDLTSGIIATVSAVEDLYVTLEISERVRVKFLRESISRKFDPAAEASKAASGGAATAATADAKK